MLGAVHHAQPDGPDPVIAPTASGGGRMLAMFPELDQLRAIIRAADIAMSGMLPPDRLAFTITVPMLDRLLSLDPEKSFLGKLFIKGLRNARKS